jgi:hypothetical protein
LGYAQGSKELVPQNHPAALNGLPGFFSPDYRTLPIQARFLQGVLAYKLKGIQLNAAKTRAQKPFPAHIAPHSTYLKLAM